MNLWQSTKIASKQMIKPFGKGSSLVTMLFISLAFSHIKHTVKTDDSIPRIAHGKLYKHKYFKNSTCEAKTFGSGL